MWRENILLRFILWDDEEKQLNQAAAMRNAYLGPCPDLSGQVEIFQSGNAPLMRAEDAEGFDLYVLDILMPEWSGIDTGRQLRALGKGGTAACLTNSNGFAAAGYDVRTCCTDSAIDSQTIRITFREVDVSLLADQRFCLCGASFTLNFQHVTGGRKGALLDNGQAVIQLRTSAAEFKKVWENYYWLEEKNAW